MSPTYATGDLYLSAYLVAVGHEVIETYGSTKKSFVFPGEAREHAKAYRAGAAVSAVDYAEGIRYIKRLVHSVDRPGVFIDHNPSSNPVPI